MPVHSISYFSNWVLAIWRRVLSAPPAFARRSLRLLYFLAFLIRRLRKRGPSDDNCLDPGKTTFPSDYPVSIQLPRLNVSQGSFTVCTSTVPHVRVAQQHDPLLVSQRDQTASAQTTHNSLHPYTYPRNAASQSSPDMGRSSETSRRSSQPDMITTLNPSGASPFTRGRASHSSHNLGTVSETSPVIDYPTIARPIHDFPYPYSSGGVSASRVSQGLEEFSLEYLHYIASTDRISTATNVSEISLALSQASFSRSYLPPGRTSPRPISIHSSRPITRALPSRAPSPSPVAFSTRPSSPISPSMSAHPVAIPAGAVHLPPPSSFSETGSTVAVPEISSVFAMSPDWSERYDRPSKINPVDAQYTLKPTTRAFTRSVPEGWISYDHPDGMLYFFHEQDKIITDAYLCDPDTLACIEMFYEQIKDMKGEVSIPPDAHLVMELMPADTCEELLCGYYYVDHANRCLFWLKEFEADYILRDVLGDISATHIKHEIESQYWKHQEFFPHLHHLSMAVVDEIRGILTHAICDTLTSEVTTVSYSSETLTSMLHLANGVKDGLEQDPHATASLSRIMVEFTHQRFMNFHGQQCPRLSRNQSIYILDKRRSFIVSLLSPFLFSAPDIHMRALEEMYIDHVVRVGPWTTFMEKLNKEWQEFLLLGEVLLTVNVSFLAIPSVDTSNPNQNAPPPHRSLAQIASYISIVATVGSIFMGLLLARQNRTKARDTAVEASHFLRRMSQTTFGLGTLAVLFSLPYALLMWGMLAFVAAFSSLCFLQTELPSRLSVGLSGAATLVLVMWCIWTAWETRELSWQELWKAAYETSKDNCYLKKITLLFAPETLSWWPLRSRPADENSSGRV